MGQLGYFLTWVVHGTWLHGDERGSVNDAHNQVGEPLLPANPRRVQAIRALTQGEVRPLDNAEQEIVHATLQRHCEFRTWTSHAINVRTAHVHIVVTCSQGVAPDTAMSEFKAWSTRRLREAKLRRPQDKVWAAHGSTRWLNDQNSLARAIDYVLNQQ